MKQREITPTLAPEIPFRQRPIAVVESLQEQHGQLRTQLIKAILDHSLSRSQGEGWTTVLVPNESMTPIRLDRGFGQPAVRAIYLYDPKCDADETMNLVVDIVVEPDFSGAYCLETNRDNSVFSTSALLILLSALEADEFRVDLTSCTHT